MSFDDEGHQKLKGAALSQSLWNRAMSFDTFNAGITILDSASQSLWNRAMSFDVKFGDALSSTFVSIPLEQGNVFRQPNILYG